MSTLVEYLVRTKDQTFEEMMFNEVDGLILAYVASFLHYTNIKKQGSLIFSALKDEKGMRQFTSRPAHPNNQKLLKTLSQSKRYCEVEIFYPLEVIKPKEKEKFRAITYQLPNAMRVVAFKGSDSSLLSWEENSQILLKRPLPAVLSAVDYLKETMALSDNAYYIVGYSKGGHIASAASLLVPDTISKQVQAVYSYDGPGISHIEELNELTEKVDFEQHKFIPSESFIGALFEEPENYQVVESTVNGLEQHNPHSWSIQNNQFVLLPKMSKKSAWLSRLANSLHAVSEEKKAMETIDYYFSILKESEIVSIRDFNQMSIQKLRRIYRQRQALVDQNKGYALFDLIKLITILLGRELKATIAALMKRKLRGIKKLKSRLVESLKVFLF